jgi:hypothetical protein
VTHSPCAPNAVATAEKSRRSPWRPEVSRDWNWLVSAAIPLG